MASLEGSNTWGQGISSSSRSLSTGSGLAALNSEIGKLFECPVCTEIPLPPIYTCQAGHSICKNCKTKLRECALCKKPYTNSRNYTLESIVLAAKFYCIYRLKGCIAIGTVEELKDHHNICALRPIQCHLSNFNNCKGPLLYIPEYVPHLKHIHSIRTLLPSKTDASTFTETFSFNIVEGDLNRETNWIPSLLNFDGNVFTRLVFKKGYSFFIKFYLIGFEADACKYTVKITVTKSPDCKFPRYQLTKIVPSIHKVSRSNDGSPHLALHYDLMENLGSKHSALGQRNCKSKLEWSIQYKIKKL